MIKIFEMQQQLNDVTNYQSRVVEYESFREYLQNLNDNSLPLEHLRGLDEKHVDFNRKTITFRYEHKLGGAWFEFTHFARVLD